MTVYYFEIRKTAIKADIEIASYRFEKSYIFDNFAKIEL